MPFWMRTSRTMLILKAIPVAYKIITTITVLGSIIAFLFLGLYLPRKQKIYHKQQELLALRQHHKQFNDVAGRYEKIVSENSKLVEQFNQKTTQRRFLQQIIGSILDDMRQCGISCRSIQPQSKELKDGYQRHILSIHGKGMFSQILAFLELIQVSDQILAFKSFTIDKGKGLILKFGCLIEVMSIKEVISNG